MNEKSRVLRSAALLLALGAGTSAVEGCVALGSDIGATDEFICHNTLHGRFDATIKAGANIRTTPHRYDNAGNNLVGVNEYDSLPFEVGNRPGGVGVCVSKNGQGTWYGFKDKKISNLIGLEIVDGDDHEVWVNKDQNIDTTPIE